MDKLKVGDKVRVKRYNTRPQRWNSEGKMDMYMGTIVTISSVCCASYSDRIQILEDNGYWTWKTEDFEKVEKVEADMTKSDLKTGMIVTTKEGEEYAVLLGAYIEGKEIDVLSNASKMGQFRLRDYNKDLTMPDNPQFNIVKIESPIHVFGIQKLEYGKNERTLLWERKEPKKMTVAEIEQELGYQIEIIK